MASKAEELNLKFDLSEITWGDMVDIQSGRYDKLLPVCSRLGRIDGKTPEEVRTILARLSIDDVGKIDGILAQALRDRSNPTDETGKN